MSDVQSGPEPTLAHQCIIIIRFATSDLQDLLIPLRLPTTDTITAESATGIIATTAANAQGAQCALGSSSARRPGDASSAPYLLADRATANDLKAWIRPRLPLDLRRNRLRLIYAGRILPDEAPLRLSLGRVVLGIDGGPPRDGNTGRGGGGKGRVTGVDVGVNGNVNARTEVKERGSDSGETRGKGKGKAKRMEGDGEDVEEYNEVDTSTPASMASAARRIYIHCSIGYIPERHVDNPSLPPTIASSSVSASQQQHLNNFQHPQGFDRLLAPNFTSDDVTNLRSQFRSLLSYTHTPDRMPSRAAQRTLEERWMDGDINGSGAITGIGRSHSRRGATGNGSAYAAGSASYLLQNQQGEATTTTGNDFTTPLLPNPRFSINNADVTTDINVSLIDTDDNDTNTNTGTGTGIGIDTETETAVITNANTDADADADTSLEDMLLGNVLGFFWPGGALVWGLREENVWTRRRQVSVLTGLLMNLMFGFLKMVN